MILTDTHTHLYSEAFDNDREIVIRNAFESGITRFFLPAIDSTYTNKMYKLANEYPQNIFLMAGLHPTHVKKNYKDEINHIANELSRRKFVAVGEIGIDLYWDKTTYREQEDAFRLQIGLAKEYKLPIVIHCRNAFDEIFKILNDEKSEDLFGIFHCFTGDLQQARKAISYNMKLGIGGVVTFKNGKIDKFLSKIDLSDIVLETDAPYLSPVPYRGRRNESAYLVNILEKVANIYGTSKSEVASVTTQNSIDVFGV
ncbi:MAG: hydrolase TatD [Flavobacteriaceae bacterium]|nr:hydrolase TatD [Flavobacteriaceae bacterium]|tara:strand:- start:1134 stop:1901 length:768 start_codon:yes stop_codon:yes gene_type:complete